MITREISAGPAIVPLPTDEIAAFRDNLNSTRAVQISSIGSDGNTQITLVQSFYKSSGTIDPIDDNGWVDCSATSTVDGADESIVIATTTFYGRFLGVKVEPTTATTGTIEIYW